MQLHKPPRRSAQPASGALAAIRGRQESFATALERLALQTCEIDQAAAAMIRTLQSGGRVLVAGNGGSAAEAQHFATELVGRFLKERAPYAVMALTADTAVLTAVANDYGYDTVFARQVAAFGQPSDVFLAFSTSGESANLVLASETARARGMTVVALTGGRRNRLAGGAHIAIRVPSGDTPVVQELHTIVLHVLCDLVETALAAGERTAAAR